MNESHEWTGPSADPHDVQFGDVIERTTVEDADDYDAVLVGEPYDGAVLGRIGAAEAPDAVRHALVGVKTHHFETGDVTAVADLGDADLPDGDVSTVQRTLETTTKRVHRTDAFPVFVGGDNSLTVPNVRPLLSDSVGVLSFDAHLDCREVLDEPTSGTPYRQLFEDGLDDLAVVGARDFETAGDYDDYLVSQGGTVHPARDVENDPVETVREALSGLDADSVYVSLDTDVLDQSHAPGVSAPTPGGLSTHALYEALSAAVADPRVVGFEVVECAPPLDESGRTTRAVSRAIAHVLAEVTNRE
mgnify:CR=1 FL=1|jgi:formimidoylglutamase